MAAGVTACFGWMVAGVGSGCSYSGVNFGSRKKQSGLLLSCIVSINCFIVHDLVSHLTKAMHLNLNLYALLPLLSRNKP